MNCPECGSHILDDCLYCPTCGKPTRVSPERSVGLRRPVPPKPVQTQAVAPAETPAPTPLPEVLPHTPPATLADPRALNNLLTQANLSRVRGNWSEAIDHCVAVLQADPANAAAHAMLGDIYAARGRREDAVQWYRMALEIHPNPIDEAKLHRVEREMEQQGRSVGKGQQLAEATPALPSDGQGPVGTVALMGVSPRLWLRGITATALGFLVVAGAILLGTQNRRLQGSTVPHPVGDPGQGVSIAPAAGSVGALPPPRIGGPAIVPGGQANTEAASGHVAGSGLAPDNTSMSHTVPTAAPDSRQSGANTPPAAPFSTNVPTAPIRDVRPLGHSDIPTFTTLSGGMKLAKISSLDTGGESVLVLANPPANSDQENFRQNAIRNVYRAARNAFVTNEAAKEASIYIQTDLTEKGGAVLMSAQLDRDSALKSDPEADRPENLLNHLRSVHWGP